MKIIFIFFFSTILLGQTPCLDAVANATGLIGEFVPQCEEDGSYSPIQCWASTGYCWCVDEYGVEIIGTSTGPGEGLPDCENVQTNLCDSIELSIISYNLENQFQISVDIQFSGEYWLGYCGLLMTNNLCDTIALENINTASNVYCLGPGMSEIRYLEIIDENLQFPIEGEIHLIEGFFAGDGVITCSWPFSFDSENTSQMMETSIQTHIIKKVEILGRNSIENLGLQFYIYNNGEVEKKYFIK